MSDLYEVMSTLRAVRRLKPDPIPTAVMERVLQAACWAPSGGNQQPWRVIVVTDPELKAQLQTLYEPEWRKYSAGFLAAFEGQPPEVIDRWQRVVAAGDHLAANLADAPAILVFCANPERMAITDAHFDRVSIVGGGSVYPAVQNTMLACVQEGLGCCITTLHCLREPDVVNALDIPEPWVTAALVPIGYPAGRGHGPITRNPPQKMAYSDTFGTPLDI